MCRKLLFNFPNLLLHFSFISAILLHNLFSDSNVKICILEVNKGVFHWYYPTRWNATKIITISLPKQTFLSLLTEKVPYLKPGALHWPRQTEISCFVNFDPRFAVPHRHSCKRWRTQRKWTCFCSVMHSLHAVQSTERAKDPNNKQRCDKINGEAAINSSRRANCLIWNQSVWFSSVWTVRWDQIITSCPEHVLCSTLPQCKNIKYYQIVLVQFLFQYTWNEIKLKVTLQQEMGECFKSIIP